jgi:hypothetical protein
MHGSRSKTPSKKSRPYIYVKFLDLLGAAYIYDISRLRVNSVFTHYGSSIEERVFLVEYVFREDNRYTDLVQEQFAKKIPRNTCTCGEQQTLQCIVIAHAHLMS